MVFDVIIGRSKKDVEKYGKQGTVFLGKQYIQMGQSTSLSNPVLMDIASAHVAFIVGKRGSGKCVLDFTKISLSDGSTKNIKEIYEDLEKDSLIINKTEKEELLRPQKIVKVISINGHLGVVEKPILAIYRKFIEEDLIKITTTSGKEIIITKEHPLLVPITVENKGLCQVLWKKASLIRETETVMIFEENIVKEDKIEEIKKIKYKGWVYDLTIPETHNFIANNIISHNSYTMGMVAEGLTDLPLEIKQNLSIVLLDTMGIYWTMKYPNFQDAEILKDWKIEPRGLDVKIYTPTGFYYEYKNEGIPTDFPFSLRPLDVGPHDWCTAFNLDPNSAEGVLITKIVQDLSKKEESYDLDLLIDLVKKDTESDKVVKSVVANQFEKAKGWEIFSKEGTPLKDIIAPGQVTVLDVSPYATMASGWEIKALVVGLICRNLFNQRMLARKTEEFKSVDAAMHYFTKQTEEKMEEPLVWIALDEAHELLPKDGKTAATEALITILREGRQPGISLILASQQPGKIHTDVMTQSDIVIAHRLTARLDVEALSQLTQSYMRQGLEQELDHLPRVKGAAVIFDDANERIFPVQLRPRFTWHGGGSPSAISEKKEYFNKSLEELKKL
ncbi:MAG: hypothetical protein Q8R47_01740 [Nanoarchaeota archaeon]|nr:hypothetical protein [Nanoarchaeota archaeon]